MPCHSSCCWNWQSHFRQPFASGLQIEHNLKKLFPQRTRFVRCMLLLGHHYETMQSPSSLFYVCSGFYTSKRIAYGSSQTNRQTEISKCRTSKFAMLLLLSSTFHRLRCFCCGSKMSLWMVGLFAASRIIRFSLPFPGSNVPAPLLPSIMTQATDLPSPPSFDVSPQQRPSRSGPKPPVSTSEKKIPKWLKVGLSAWIPCFPWISSPDLVFQEKWSSSIR